MGALFSIFGNAKNFIVIIMGLFGATYIAKQKYSAYKAEKKLGNIEKKIAKTNVVIAKKKAEAKAASVKAETDTEIGILKGLKNDSENVQNEMQNIQKNIKTAELKEPVPVSKTRHRTSKKITIEV